MTTLADIRTRVRKDLHDTDALRWSDEQLDRHIEHALGDVNLAIPRELTATIATTPGSRDVSLAALTALIEVEAAEYPVGEFVPAYVRFSRWADTLSLHLENEPEGEDVKLYYTARHTLDGSGSTLPAFLEDLVAMGAGAQAALGLTSFSIDQLNTGGPAVAEQYAAHARARQTAFRQLLMTHGRKNRVRGRRLYVPA